MLRVIFEVYFSEYIWAKAIIPGLRNNYIANHFILQNHLKSQDRACQK